MTGSRRSKPSATDFVIASRRCDITSLENFRQMGELVVAVSNLVHALQRERGVSSLYLGSSGRRHRVRVKEMIEASDGRLHYFHTALPSLQGGGSGVPGGGRLLGSIACAVHFLSELKVLRARVEKQMLNPASATAAYSELVARLMAVAFEAVDTVAEPTLSRSMVALFNFMQGKEFAGQERAAGAAGFAAGRFDSDLVDRLRCLADAQDRCLQTFCDFAEPPHVQTWEGVCNAPETSELERLRHLAVRAHQELPASAPNLEERWFEITTGRVDAMKSLEDRLQTRLQELCEGKLAEARGELNTRRGLVEKLTRSGDETQFVFFCGADDGLCPQTMCSSNGLSPRLGRSLVDLMLKQSRRLQAMNEELSATQAALETLRLVDRAKRLLMKHKGMTEKQAHQLMRRTAMNQSRPLADVARAMLSVAEVWSGEQ